MEQIGTASGSMSSNESSSWQGMVRQLIQSFPGHPNLNLTPEEKRFYGNLLKEADPDGFGAVTGDVAVKFFERTRLPPDVLGQVCYASAIKAVSVEEHKS